MGPGEARAAVAPVAGRPNARMFPDPAAAPAERGFPRTPVQDAPSRVPATVRGEPGPDRPQARVTRDEGATTASDGASNTDASAAPTIVLNGDLVIDGRALGRIVSAAQAGSLVASPTGGRSVSLRTTPLTVGHLIAPP